MGRRNTVFRPAQGSLMLAAILANTLNITTTFQNDRNILRRN
jgi:hypothetical protein